MRLHSRRVLIALLLAIAPLSAAHADGDIGVVVLHGKQGMPADRNVGPFIQALRNAGYAVQAPGMCWSHTRIYDKPFPECLAEIDTAIGALRAEMGALKAQRGATLDQAVQRELAELRGAVKTMIAMLSKTLNEVKRAA